MVNKNNSNQAKKNVFKVAQTCRLQLVELDAAVQNTTGCDVGWGVAINCTVSSEGPPWPTFPLMALQ